MVGTVKVFICYKKLLSRSKGGQIVVQENLRGPAEFLAQPEQRNVPILD